MLLFAVRSLDHTVVFALIMASEGTPSPPLPRLAAQPLKPYKFWNLSTNGPRIAVALLKEDLP
jgi:hypothetical protein